MEQIPKTGRRTILKRGFAGLVGVVSLGFLGKTALDSGGSGPAPAVAAIRLYGRNWHLYGLNKQARTPVSGGERLVASGELYDSAEGGTKVGDYVAACFCTASPLASNSGGAMLELQTFKMLDGSTIVGVATGPQGHDQSFHAVIGGAGRYTGVTGSYVAVQRPAELGGNGTAEFTLHLNA